MGLPMASDLGSYQWSFSREEGPVADGNADEGFGITQRRSEIASQSSTPVLSYYPSLCRLLHYQKSTDPLTRHAQVSPPPEKRCRKMDAILVPPTTRCLLKVVPFSGPPFLRLREVFGYLLAVLSNAQGTSNVAVVELFGGGLASRKTAPALEYGRDSLQAPLQGSQR